MLGPGSGFGFGLRFGSGSGISVGAVGYNSCKKGCMGKDGIFASLRNETILCTGNVKGGGLAGGFRRCRVSVARGRHIQS